MLFSLLDLISVYCPLAWKGTWWRSLEKVSATAAAAPIKPFTSQPSSLGWGVAWPCQFWAQAPRDLDLAAPTLLEPLTTAWVSLAEDEWAPVTPWSRRGHHTPAAPAAPTHWPQTHGQAQRRSAEPSGDQQNHPEVSSPQSQTTELGAK